MAHQALILALTMIAAAAPLSASQPDPAPVPAPAGGPDTKYCMRVELTGNIIEPVRCWTREQWAEQGVDVDKEWAEEGVRVIG